MDIPVLINPECEYIRRVHETIKRINLLQSYFRLSLVEADWLPNHGRKVYTEKIRQLVDKNFQVQPSIVVVQNPLEQDDFFSYAYRYLYIVTVYDWEARFAPPPLNIYLTYLFAEALLNFAVDLPEEKIEQWVHDPPIGCFFDIIYELESLRLGMIGANLCGECEVKLFGMGLTDQALKAVEGMLMFVREATIRRPRATPSYVFIGHGHSDVWKQLQRFLNYELNLQVEEFNQQSVAGSTTAERLQEMLGRSCFAFLVMTAEDEHKDERYHARENVVHEIGLFQGRLGFKKAIILKEKDCAEFSNIHGLTYIEFPKDKLDGAAKAKIRQALKDVGLL